MVSRRLLLMLCLGSIVSVQAQETRIKATRVVPLYCYTDILRGYDSTCVNRFRVTFKNADEIRVKNIKIQLTISETKGDEPLILYDAKHDIEMQMNTGETYTADIPLINPITPPEGERSFTNRSSWKWEVEVISINRRTQ